MHVIYIIYIIYNILCIYLLHTYTSCILHIFAGHFAVCNSWLFDLCALVSVQSTATGLDADGWSAGSWVGRAVRGHEITRFGWGEIKVDTTIMVNKVDTTCS